MPNNVSTNMDEKLKFMSRYLDGEKIAVLCQEFGISRVINANIPTTKKLKASVVEDHWDNG